MDFDGNGTPQTHPDDVSTIAPFDDANDDWEDDSVAGGADGDGVFARRRKRRSDWIEGVERDKREKIMKTCGIAECQYKTGQPGAMKIHKAAKHGINVV